MHIKLRLINKPYDEKESITFFYYDYEEKDYVKCGPFSARLAGNTEHKFYVESEYLIEDAAYSDMIRQITGQITNYINLKYESCDNSFSEKLTGYPAELDTIFSDSYEEWKEKAGIDDITSSIVNEALNQNIPIWVSLDNPKAWNKYLNNEIKVPASGYYIGNAYCHLLIPDNATIKAVLNKAQKEGRGVTVVLPYLREEISDTYIKYLDYVVSLSCNSLLKISYEINDIGWIEIMRERNLSFSYGRLINKRRKDPRYKYKQRFDKLADLMKDNSMNDVDFVNHLKMQGLDRVECESPDYEINMPDISSALHIPFYQTNTSQFCPLYAIVHNNNRGCQKFICDCDKPCLDKYILYPDHLKTVGMYNSIFAVDTWLSEHPEVLKAYADAGMDRIVLNHIPEEEK